MFPRMVDMKKTVRHLIKDAMPFGIGEASEYPWGLTLRLGDEELEKLGLDSDCEVGDYIHLFCLAKVTSVSRQDTGDGEKSNIELQITHMGCESEDEENEKAEEEMNTRRRGLYR